MLLYAAIFRDKRDERFYVNEFCKRRDNLKIGHIRYIDFPYFFEVLNYRCVFLSRNVIKSVTIVFEKMIDIDRIEIIFF